MNNLIYFPGFEVQDQTWLKFALLYFDQLRPIIPYPWYSDCQYLSSTFQHVMGETDLINPYRPDYEEGACASVLACEEFERYLSNPKIYRTYFHAGRSGSYIERWKTPTYQDCTLFHGKYSQTFFDFCTDHQLATPCDEGIHISNDLAFVYMSLLADVISKRHEYEMITDNKRYAQYLISKELTLPHSLHQRICVAQNEIDFSLPAKIQSIPLERFVELRKQRSFNEVRHAYMEQIDQLIAHQESGEFFSMDELLSCKKELMKIAEHVCSFTASAVLTCSSFYSLLDGQPDQPVPALASVALNIAAISDACRELPQYAASIKSKRLARRYVARIKTLNQPVPRPRYR